MAKITALFHKFKSIVGYSIAFVVIIIALSVSGLRLILTTANLYQQEVEQLASDLLKQTVKIGRIDAELIGLIPTLVFYDVQLLSEKTKKSLFSLARIDVGLSFEELLWQQKIIPEQVTIRGMDLHVTRSKEGKLKVKGFDLEGLSKTGESGSTSALESWLLQKGEVGLEGSTLTWVDEKNAGLTWHFDDINFLLKKNKNRNQFLLSSKLPRTLGSKIKLSFDLKGDITKPSTWDIKSFVESKRFKSNAIQAYIKDTKIKLIHGDVDLKLWLDWDKEKLQHLSGDVKLHDFSYRLEKNKTVKLKLLSGMFDSQRDKNDIWNVSVDKFNYESDVKVLNKSKFSLAFNYAGENVDTFNIKADYLKLENLSKIMLDNHFLKPKHENTINHLNLRGEIRDFYIAWKNNELEKLDANFNGFGVNAWKNIPKIKGMSGNILYAQQEGVISLLSSNAMVGFPELFRDNFKLEQFNANVVFSRTKQGLFFDIKDLITKNTAIDAISAAKLWLPADGSSPYIDLQTHVLRGNAAKTSHFLPVTIMDKGLVSWLDKGIIKGNVDKATVVLNGRLNDFPFDDKKGVFLVDVELSDFVLNYVNGWPKITDAKVIAGFTGQGLTINLLTGKAEKNILYDSYAEIKSYSNAELDLNISASGSTYTAVQYLVNSSILSKAKNTLNTMRFSGEVTTDIKLNIPLADKIKKPLTYSGSAKLSNVSAFMLKDKIDITKGFGTLLFNEKKISSKNMVANILDKPMSLSVSSALKYKSINIAAKGKIQPGEILKRFDIPGAKNVSGVTSFKANMLFPNNGLKSSHPSLIIYSDLSGVKSAFPEFLHKGEKEKNKFRFTTIFSPSNKTKFAVDFAHKGSAIIELDQSGKNNYLRRGAVSFSTKKAVLPGKNILYVDGSINKITPSKWLAALDLDKVKGKNPFFVKPVIFNLDELNILINKKDEGKYKSKAANPRKLPSIEGIVKKLSYDGIFLGRLDFKTSKKRKGLHFDEIILSAKNMKLFSHGDWLYTRGKHKTELGFTLSSDDFGGMLTDLDFAAVIRKGLAQASGKLEWQHAPSEFSLEKLNGDIQLIISNGNITEVDAGAGRLLGLFSLSDLPRKLLGDFAEFKSGFSFDTAEGEINIETGDAYTENFAISSPVAQINISGRTGLADRDYENVVEVIPDVGGGLAGITALLVNLPAGVGLWLVDKITGKQFNEASRKTYEVSGSWESPEIELIEE